MSNKKNLNALQESIDKFLAELSPEELEQLKSFAKDASSAALHINEDDWRLTHPEAVRCASDIYYTRLVNRLIDVIAKFHIPNPPLDFERWLALSVAAYLEDLVNDFGVWNAFRNLYRRTYGTTLPFYDCEHGDYMPDNVNIEDLKFIIWQAFNRCGQAEDRIFSPYSQGVNILSEALFDEIVDEFEHAPESTRIADMISSYLSSGDYLKIRSLSAWLSLYNPLIAAPFWPEYIEEEIGKYDFGDSDIDPHMVSYIVSSSYSWSEAAGPLGISATAYLAQMCRDRGLDSNATDIADIVIKPLDDYMITDRSGRYYTLTDYDGATYKVLKNSFRNNREMGNIKCCMLMLVRFKDNWNLNGAMLSLTESDFQKRRQQNRLVSHLTPATLQIIDRLIEQHDGRMVFLFDTLEKVNDFLGIPPMDDNNTTSDMRNIALLLSRQSTPLMFNGGAAYFKIKGNRRYSVRKSEKSGLELIADGLPDDVAAYIQQNHLAPDLQIKTTQGKETGIRVVQENLRFLAGFYRTKAVPSDDD